MLSPAVGVRAKCAFFSVKLGHSYYNKLERLLKKYMLLYLERRYIFQLHSLAKTQSFSRCLKGDYSVSGTRSPLSVGQENCKMCVESFLSASR